MIDLRVMSYQSNPLKIWLSCASAYGGSFDMMIVPEAANMPPTSWQPRFWHRRSERGSAAHLAHALLQGIHAVNAGMPPPLVRSGSLAAEERCYVRR
jgi:hypothetical protein